MEVLHRQVNSSTGSISIKIDVNNSINGDSAIGWVARDDNHQIKYAYFDYLGKHSLLEAKIQLVCRASEFCVKLQLLILIWIKSNC